MLREDIVAREAIERDAEKKRAQSGINDHFSTMKPEDKPVQYTDEVFKDTAIQWLIETNQVRSSTRPGAHLD